MTLDTDALARLLAAIMLRAVRDAQHGDRTAAAWLLEEAEAWCGGVIGIDFAELATFARSAA